MVQHRSTRREFLTRSAAAGAVAAYFWTARRAKAESANDRPKVGAIGVSIYTDRWGQTGQFDGRGSVIGHQAAQLGNMVACCDVNRRYAETFASRYDGRCNVYEDFRRLLDRKDIDAVTIGTPDHWHAIIAIAAMHAGKDVYCEKPLTLTIDEGRQICRVAKETGRVFQVGTQQRSEYDMMFLKAAALVRGGRLGKTIKVVSSVGQPDFVTDKKLGEGPFPNSDPPANLNWDFWLGQTPKVPYCKHRCDYDFRWWLEYSGGQVTDWGVHHTDIAVWALGLDGTAGDLAGTVEIEGTGDYPRIENGFSVARSFDCTLRFAAGHEIRLISGPNELLFSGEGGRIRVNRGGLTGKPVEELTDKDDGWLRDEMMKLTKGKQPGNHMGNFFECVRDRALPISDVFSHHRAVSACHLANIAMRLRRKLRWDLAKEDFVDDKEASAMLSRPQREPYSITTMGG